MKKIFTLEHLGEDADEKDLRAFYDYLRDAGFSASNFNNGQFEVEIDKRALNGYYCEWIETL